MENLDRKFMSISDENKTFFNHPLFEKLLGILLFIIGGGILFTDFENLDATRIIVIILLFISGGILERKFLIKQNEINIQITKNNIPNSFKKIIKVDDEIIKNLENLSKDATEGDRILLKTNSSFNDVTLTSSSSLVLNGDFTFLNSDDMMELVFTSGKWHEFPNNSI